MTRIIFVLFVAIVLLAVTGTSPVAAADEEGLIAVAADGPAADAPVSQQAARCVYFLLFDARGQLIETVANPYRQARGGAGPQVVDFLAQKGVHTVIAGEFGPRMGDALQRKGMASRVATGSAAEVVKQVQ